ncbi:ubiquitin thioesterase protein OTUB1 [Strigomonas culicis]|uniref:ubiquitinyl hydrolase 1 n=1 Tax=Strigomonas culicis TaxID=28005 RepID=S9VI22_9TRYP|nr:ubiquitin thioesterase protein OTUB1 [Strigomonas culicis]|eukprot:EPY26731.1 ubiquitin thioesterase protein OTUB1 [Strigomonas culicis]
MTSDCDQTNAQLEDIREQVLKAPLLSKAEALTDSSRLVAEFAEDAVFSQKVSSLIGKGMFRFVRYARRDGNCFFRCASYELFDLMRREEHFVRECEQQLHKWRNQLNTIFGEYSGDFCDVVEEVIADISAKRMQTRDDVIRVCTSEDASYIIVYFRYLVSAYLREHADEYLPFVMGRNYATVASYCEVEVEPIDHESDDLQAAALAKMFNVSINIALLERTEGDIHMISLNRAVDDSERRLELHLLFRPGHYDALEM